MQNKLTTFLLLPALFILFSCKEDKLAKYDPGKDLGALHISKEKPLPGDTLMLTYHRETVTDELETEAFFHYFVGSVAYAEDIDLTESSGEWKGRIIIPDSATAVAFNISQNGKVDHNSKKGYIVPLYDDQGELRPGSNASIGYSYYRLMTQYEVANDSSLALITRDLDEYPYLKKDWDKLYVNLLNSSDKEEAKNYINGRIEEYSKEKSPDEKTLSNLLGFYNILKDKEKADSIQELIAARFPLGKTMESQNVSQFYQTSVLPERLEIFEEYQQKFGKNGTGNDKNYMLRSLAEAYAGQEDWENFEKYSDNIDDNFTKGYVYNDLAASLAEKEKDLDRAATFSKRSLDIFEHPGNTKKSIYGTQKQHERWVEIRRKMCADTYALILFKQGDIKQALKYQEEAVGEGENSEYNERYLEFLIADNDHKGANIAAASFIANNSANARAKGYYRETYLKAKGSAMGLEESLSQLERKGYEKAMRDLRKEILNEEAPDFRLADLDGNEIVLSSLRGKTVILDFWATWCKPCIAAFPGMQMAVDKYKDDKDVKFLFLNTLEFGNNENLNAEIRELMEKDNYSFQVLIDGQSEEGAKNKTARDYNVSAIPTKIIIGPDGKLKFRKTGDSGNSEQIVQEFDIIIDLLNNYDDSAPGKAAI